MAQSATPFCNVVKAGGGGAAAITATGAAATTAAAESARDVKNHMFYSVPLPITVLPHHSKRSRYFPSCIECTIPSASNGGKGS